MATVGSSRFAAHICPDTVRHWSVTDKKFPAIIQLLHVLSPGSPVCAARGGDWTTELACGSHPRLLSHDDVIHDNVRADVAYGRTLVSEVGSAADIRDSVFHPWLSF